MLITLLIQGFSPVNAWLLIMYDTTFYAIILNYHTQKLQMRILWMLEYSPTSNGSWEEAEFVDGVLNPLITE